VGEGWLHGFEKREKLGVLIAITAPYTTALSIPSLLGLLESCLHRCQRELGRRWLRCSRSRRALFIISIH
jgi:hypothetical protein